MCDTRPRSPRSFAPQVLADLAITITNLGLSLSHCSLTLSDGVRGTLQAVTAASVGVLSLFLLEFAVSVWAFGLSWLGNIAHVADVLVVAVALGADCWELRDGE